MSTETVPTEFVPYTKTLRSRSGIIHNPVLDTPSEFQHNNVLKLSAPIRVPEM
jgi:hypothetical protein